MALQMHSIFRTIQHFNIVCALPCSAFQQFLRFNDEGTNSKPQSGERKRRDREEEGRGEPPVLLYKHIPLYEHTLLYQASLWWYSNVCSCELCKSMNVETYYLSWCCDLIWANTGVLLSFFFLFFWKCIWICKQSDQSPHLRSYYTSVLSFLLHSFITFPCHSLYDKNVFH